MFFDYKFIFTLLFIIPILLIFYLIGLKLKKSRLDKFANKNILKELVPTDTLSRQILKLILKLLAIFFIVIALAGPRFGKKIVEVNRRGLDVFIAIDTSTSMLAEDVKPNRISIAKNELARIVNALSQNRIGIIAFAGESILQCPLTLDLNAVKLFLDFVKVGTVPEQGTDLSKVIKLALNNFNQKEKQYKILLILTDGEDHSANVLKLADEAGKQGIKIFTIGIGNKNGEIIPIRDENGKLIDYKKDNLGNTVTTKLDENLLNNIAKVTDGKYYYSKTGFLNIEKIVEDINSFEKKDLLSKMSQQYEHRFYYFLIIGIIILLIENFITESNNNNKNINNELKIDWQTEVL